jgi:hypothetical protein
LTFLGPIPIRHTLPNEKDFAKRDAAMNYLCRSAACSTYIVPGNYSGGHGSVHPLGIQRTTIMNFFETMGEFQLQRAEGDRQIAAALANGLHRLWQSAAHRITAALSHMPHPSPRG